MINKHHVISLVIINITIARMILGSSVSLRVEEEIEPPKSVLNLLESTDLKEQFTQEMLAQFRFGILSSGGSQKHRAHHAGVYHPGKDFFALAEKNTSDLLLVRKIDREEVCGAEVERCFLFLQIAVLSPVKYFQVLTVHINVVDINDNPPRFISRYPFIVEVSEDATPGSTFVLPAAFDLDSPDNGIARYQIREFMKSEELPFDLLETSSGQTAPRLLLKRELDREAEEIYEFKFVVTDAGTPALEDVIDVRVLVQDSNDNHPRFQQNVYQLTIFENATLGSTIAVLTATDEDSGTNGQISYFIDPILSRPSNRVFNIDSSTGELRLAKELDYETDRRFQFKVHARDHGEKHANTASCDVVVEVLDVNDNAPIITVATATDRLEVDENEPGGTFVAYITVEDPDSGAGGRWTCSLDGRDATSFIFERLKISNEGQFKLLTSVSFDREIADKVEALITCMDEGSPPMIASKQIRLEILDKNDNKPVFTKHSLELEVEENNKIGQVIGRIEATDPDEGDNSKLTYRFSDFINPDLLKLFNLDANSGSLTAKSSLDREFEQFYHLPVEVNDSGSPSLFSTALVTLQVKDVNDNSPTFSEPEFSFGTFENQPPGIEIGQITAIDDDSPPFSEISYAIDNFLDVFSINKQTGKITALRSLDREAVPAYAFKVIAWNSYPLNHTLPTTTASVSVIVADRNDNAPKIIFPRDGRNNSIQVSNRTPIGSQISRVIATDSDVGSNSNLRFIVVQSEKEQQPVSNRSFDVDPWSGYVYVASDLQNISYRVEQLCVIVHDEGFPRLSAVCCFRIVINSSVNTTAAFLHAPSALGITSPQPLLITKRGNSTAPSSIFSTIVNFPVSFVVLVSAMTGTLLVFLLIVFFVLCCNKRQRARRLRLSQPVWRPPDLMYVPKFAMKKSHGESQKTPVEGPDSREMSKNFPCKNLTENDLTFYKEKYFLTSKSKKTRRRESDRSAPDFLYFANGSCPERRSGQRNRLSLPGQFSVQDPVVSLRNCNAEDRQTSQSISSTNHHRTSSHHNCCRQQLSKLQQQQRQDLVDSAASPMISSISSSQPEQHTCNTRHSKCYLLPKHQNRTAEDQTSTVDSRETNILQVSYSSSTNDTHLSGATRSTSLDSSQAGYSVEQELNKSEPMTAFPLATKLILTNQPSATNQRWVNYSAVDPPSEY